MKLENITVYRGEEDDDYGYNSDIVEVVRTYTSSIPTIRTVRIENSSFIQTTIWDGDNISKQVGFASFNDHINHLQNKIKIATTSLNVFKAALKK